MPTRFLCGPTGSRALIAGALLTGLALSCGDDDDDEFWGDDSCRFDPDCPTGGLGAFCSHDSHCQSDFCCRDDSHCGGGMCTIPCEVDGHCPSDMLCEHDVCFFACGDDRDCAAGMSCEHGDTVCEWP